MKSIDVRNQHDKEKAQQKLRKRDKELPTEIFFLNAKFPEREDVTDFLNGDDRDPNRDPNRLPKKTSTYFNWSWLVLILLYIFPYAVKTCFFLFVYSENVT